MCNNFCRSLFLFLLSAQQSRRRSPVSVKAMMGFLLDEKNKFWEPPPALTFLLHVSLSMLLFTIILSAIAFLGHHSLLYLLSSLVFSPTFPLYTNDPGNACYTGENVRRLPWEDTEDYSNSKERCNRCYWGNGLNCSYCGLNCLLLIVNVESLMSPMTVLGDRSVRTVMKAKWSHCVKPRLIELWYTWGGRAPFLPHKERVISALEGEAKPEMEPSYICHIGFSTF